MIHDLDVIHKSLNRNRAGHRVIVSGPVGVESGTIAALDDVNTAFGEIAAQKVLENGSGGLRRASVYQETAKTGERGSSGEHRRQIEAPLKETIDGNGGSAAKLCGVRPTRSNRVTVNGCAAGVITAEPGPGAAEEQP